MYPGALMHYQSYFTYFVIISASGDPMGGPPSDGSGPPMGGGPPGGSNSSGGPGSGSGPGSGDPTLDNIKTSPGGVSDD